VIDLVYELAKARLAGRTLSEKRALSNARRRLLTLFSVGIAKANYRCLITHALRPTKTNRTEPECRSREAAEERLTKMGGVAVDMEDLSPPPSPGAEASGGASIYDAVRNPLFRSM